MPRRLSPGNKWSVVLLLALASLGALACFLIFRGDLRRPNVLWITLDSCRYDHLGCYGYRRAHTPNIDALARQGAAFSQAVSQASSTRYSVPSMVTGRYPLFVQARTFASQPAQGQKTVAEILGQMGYRTLLITQEAPVRAVARGFEQIDDTAETTVMRTRSCLRALQELKEESFFIWLYYWDPHIPYRPPPRFLKFFEPPATQEAERPKKKTSRESRRNIPIRDEAGSLKGELAVMGRINFKGDIVPTEEDRQHLINLYDAEIAFVDSEIGRVVTKLHQLGLWDETMVLITSDHGEAFGEHAKYYHGLNLYEEVVRVPLIIKPPQSRLMARLIDSPVRNVDIVPTILDYCRAPIPGQADGISLRPAMEGKSIAGQPAYMEAYYRERGTTDHLFLGYRTQTHKLVYDLVVGSAELYDLRRDPGEQNNLIQASPGEGIERPMGPLERQMREAFWEHLDLKSFEGLVQMKLAKKMDKATEERLRALGYIE